MANKEDILRKIRALIAKAQDTAVSDNEVEIFMAKARELMAKHKLSQKDLDITQEEIIETFYTSYLKVFDNINRYINNDYLSDLSYIIAKENLCTAVYYTHYKNIDEEQRTYRRIKFIGKESDVEATIELFKFAYSRFLKLALLSHKNAKFKFKNIGKVRIKILTSYTYIDRLVFVRSYLEGTIKGLKEKYAETKIELKEDPEYSLMVVNYDKALDIYVERTIGKLKYFSAYDTKNKDGKAFEEGRQDAKTNLDKKLN